MNRKCRFYLASAGIVLLAIVLRLFRLGDALEYDEIWTFENYASGPFSRIFTELALPNNHPLNSLFIKWIYVPGMAPQWIRLPALAAGILAVPLAGIAAFGLWKRRSAALWAMFFLAVLPGAVFYSQQARGYSLQLCLLLLFTAGLVTMRRHPVPGVIGILLGSIGSMLTLPTSAFYLGAIGCVSVYRCREHWKRYLPGLAALAAGGIFSLAWVWMNLENYAANQEWGIAIGSLAEFFTFFTGQMLAGIPFYLFVLLPAAFLLGFHRSWPVLWVWGCLTAAALLFNGGPERTYLPLVAATALAAAYGCTQLERRFPKLRRVIFFVVAAAGLYWIAAAYQKPYPDWYALHEEIRELPAELTILLPANDLLPLAWNNCPDAYHEQRRRLLQRPTGRARELLILNRSNLQALNGAVANGAEQEISIDVPGVPVRLNALNGYLYGLEELRSAPASGDTVIAFIRPLPEEEAIPLFNMFLKLKNSLALNLWLCPPVSVENNRYRYYLLGARIEDPGELDWEYFLNKIPGATAVFRIVPAGKRE